MKTGIGNFPSISPENERYVDYTKQLVVYLTVLIYITGGLDI